MHYQPDFALEEAVAVFVVIDFGQCRVRAVFLRIQR